MFGDALILSTVKWIQKSVNDNSVAAINIVLDGWLKINKKYDRD